jgi:hyperosmotically inducible protein
VRGRKERPDAFISAVDPEVEARARDAAERAEAGAERAADKVQEEVAAAGERLGDEAGRAADTLQEHASEAAGELRTDLERLGGEIRDEATETAAKVGPAVERIADDAALTAKIKAKLVADPETSSSAVHLDVDTNSGVVTLHGEVASEAIRAEAEKHARQTAGVRRVVNRIRLTGAAAPPAERR